MKIVCFIQDIGASGAETQLCGLAVQLKKLGYKVEVWTYVKDEFNIGILEKGKIVYRCYEDKGIKYMRIIRFFWLFKRSNPHLVIAFLPTPSMIACICKMFGCRFKLIVSERNTTQVMTLREKVKFFLFRYADAIVANSKSQGDFLIHRCPKLRDKTYVITNFTDINKFIPLRTSLNSNKLRLLTLARISEQKNVLNYIKAIEIVKRKGFDVEVNWYGAIIDHSYFDKCMETIRECELDNVFYFHAPTSSPEKEYNMADVFCLPSNYEGFPNVICEAMSCGLPILCSNVCDNPYIVTENVNGFLFNPNDIKDIAAKIINFISLDDVSKELLRKSNRAKIVQSCSIKSMTYKYKSLISKLI